MSQEWEFRPQHTSQNLHHFEFSPLVLFILQSCQFSSLQGALQGAWKMPHFLIGLWRNPYLMYVDLVDLYDKCRWTYVNNILYIHALGYDGLSYNPGKLNWAGRYIFPEKWWISPCFQHVTTSGSSYFMHISPSSMKQTSLFSGVLGCKIPFSIRWNATQSDKTWQVPSSLPGWYDLEIPQNEPCYRMITYFILGTLPETNIAPKNMPSQKETRLPIIHVHLLC